MRRLKYLLIGLALTVSACGGGSSSPTVAPEPVRTNGFDITPGQTPPAGVHGTLYGFTFAATGGIAPLTWTVTAGALPPGLMLSTTGDLTGTPTQARSTPFEFTVTVADSSSPAASKSSFTYSITITEPPAPSIDVAPPPTAIVGSPYSYQFTAHDGLAPFTFEVVTDSKSGLTVDQDGVLSGTPSNAGIFPITLSVKDSINQSATPIQFVVRVALARPAVAFSPTGTMNFARDGHTATLLLDGRVLISGGGPSIAELYDPATQLFSSAGGAMLTQGPRSAVLLAGSGGPNNGKVLVSGGGEVIAELFDPSSGNFTPTGSMVATHLGQTATQLLNGQVLIAGGETATAELYDPSTGTFTPTGSLSVSRTAHTATLLADGRVLIAGGVQDYGPGSVPIPLGPGLASAEIYDPASGKFTPTGSMSIGLAGHTATRLNDGRVLIVGVGAANGLFDPKTGAAADLFDPKTGVFVRVGNLLTPRCGFATATLDKEGTVLITGGRVCGRGAASRAIAEYFTPESEGFVSTGSLITARDGHAATRMLDGTVLITGGAQHTYKCTGESYAKTCTSAAVVLSSAELYD